MNQLYYVLRSVFMLFFNCNRIKIFVFELNIETESDLLEKGNEKNATKTHKNAESVYESLQQLEWFFCVLVTFFILKKLKLILYKCFYCICYDYVVVALTYINGVEIFFLFLSLSLIDLLPFPEFQIIFLLILQWNSIDIIIKI